MNAKQARTERKAASIRENIAKTEVRMVANPGDPAYREELRILRVNLAKLLGGSGLLNHFKA